MKATFESEDPQEIRRLTKADDMANFIWELKHNAWREYKHTGRDHSEVFEQINDMLAEFNINIDDLTG